MRSQVIQKLAADDLDYSFDFAPVTNADPNDPCNWGVNGCDWLEAGEKVVSWSLSDPAPGELTIHDAALVSDATEVMFFAAGGVPGNDYSVVCSATTSAMPARHVEATIVLRVI